MDKGKMKTIIKGYVPHGIHRKRGLVYFSNSRQKWITNIGKLKVDDILSTPTVPIVNPKKTLKNIRIVGNKKDVGVAKIEIKMEICEH